MGWPGLTPSGWICSAQWLDLILEPHPAAMRLLPNKEIRDDASGRPARMPRLRLDHAAYIG